jgi:riboflavin synthase
VFTGIIHARGRVASLETRDGRLRLRIRPGDGWSTIPAIGDSIAVQGCCLTVAGLESDGTLAFDVVPETLAKTTLGGLSVGSEVNLEPAATPATLLGGHLVQGHVDGVGEVIRVTPDWRVTVRPPSGLMEYFVPKGSVVVDGVSLTLAEVDPAGGVFEVALIPTTLEKTTLGGVRAGQRCNLECDVIAKTVVHWLKHYGRGGPRGA